MLPLHKKKMNDVLKVHTWLFSTGCFLSFKVIIVNNIHQSHLAQADRPVYLLFTHHLLL